MSGCTGNTQAVDERSSPGYGRRTAAELGSRPKFQINLKAKAAAMHRRKQ